MVNSERKSTLSKSIEANDLQLSPAKDSPKGGGRAIRFTKVLSDFCSRGLKDIILYVKRPRTISSCKIKSIRTQKRLGYIVKMTTPGAKMREKRFRK